LGNDSALALSTGNIGIGTTSPSQPLVVFKSNAADDIGQIIQQGANGTAAFLTIVGNNDAGASFNRITSSTSGGTAHWQIGGGGTASTMVLLTGGSERMRITSAGNVGIGTDAPTSLLHARRAENGNVLTVANDQTGSQVNIGVGVVSDGRPFLGTNDNSNPLEVGTQAPSDMIFLRASTEIARVTANGLTFNGDTAAANALDDYEEGTWTPTFTDTLGNDVTATNVGRYTKIGRQVTLSLTTNWSNKSAAGAGALVYMSGVPFNMNNKANGIITYYEDMNLTTVGAFTIANAGTTLCYFPIQDNAVEASFLTFGETTNTSAFWFTLTYFV
jgi:hypothetical protein